MEKTTNQQLLFIWNQQKNSLLYLSEQFHKIKRKS